MTDRDMPARGGPARTIGLWTATGVGVGAIVGGGIMVLAGVAFASAGPAAIVAFAVNGAIALLTAMSFAEIATAFPESGGTYTFAKKVLSVRSAFAVGWILWFAYIVAGVLYALGFATFAALALRELSAALGAEPPAWLAGRRFALLLATAATGAYAVSLIRRASGGGQWATIGKVAVFAVIIAVGAIAIAGAPLSATAGALDPFFDGGATGLLAAAGFTFIAVQGFDLIPAIGGEIADPERTIPRAMYLSLAAAMVIYLPLLFVVATVGVEPGEGIRALAAARGDTVFATAVERFMGPVGYWLIIVAAILSTLSALLANLLAASRVALSMARDRTLPAVLARTHAERNTPVMAISASALTLVAILFMVPDLGAAGSAASLIFLISFLLAHVTAYLARVRGGDGGATYRTPLFPLIPAAGAIACGGMAVFQAVVVPDAGAVVLIWLALGVLLYIALFRGDAETADASAEAFNPVLGRLRGKSPLVLLPIANPAHARGMIEVANALAPSEFARVLLLTIVRPGGIGTDRRAELAEAQRVVSEALGASYAAGHSPSALITAAADPWAEILRVAQYYSCQSLLIGLGDLPENGVIEARLVELLDEVECDVAVMRAASGWSLVGARRILVPVGGRGDEHRLRARVLGSICRGADREITFCTVLPGGASEGQVEDARRAVSQLAEAKVRGRPRVEVVRSDDVVGALLAQCASHDLVILGLRGAGWKRHIGEIPLRIAREAACPAILLSGRASQIVTEVYRPLRDAVSAVPWPVRRSGSERSGASRPIRHPAALGGAGGDASGPVHQGDAAEAAAPDAQKQPVSDAPGASGEDETS